jgi:hypothetical protein
LPDEVGSRSTLMGEGEGDAVERRSMVGSGGQTEVGWFEGPTRIGSDKGAEIRRVGSE